MAAQIARHLELDFLAQPLHLVGVEGVERRIEVVATDRPLRALGLRCGLPLRRLRLGGSRLLEDPLELLGRAACARGGDLDPLGEQVDVLVLEVDEVRLPQDREQVVALASSPAGALDYPEESGQLVLLDSGEQGDLADPVLEEEKGERVGAVVRSIDLLAADRQAIFLDGHDQLVDVAPQLLERVAQALHEPQVDRIVLVVELDGAERLPQGDEQVPDLGDGNRGRVRPAVDTARGRAPVGLPERAGTGLRSGGRHAVQIFSSGRSSSEPFPSMRATWATSLSPRPLKQTTRGPRSR